MEIPSVNPTPITPAINNKSVQMLTKALQGHNQLKSFSLRLQTYNSQGQPNVLDKANNINVKA